MTQIPGAVEYREQLVLEIEKGRLPRFVLMEGTVPQETSDAVALEADSFAKAASLCYLVQVVKGLSYKRSWCKRGLLGAFFTMARKWDRLEELMLRPTPGHTTPGEESLEETVLDLAVYSVKLLGYLQETHPDTFNAFISKNLDAIVAARQSIVFSE